MKKIVVGILAHVDAGKTTLTEAMLFSTGTIDKLGRVDKRDAYLDTHKIERDRGITVFSKQAILEFGDVYMTLIDTPGHIDFSCDAERALAVQDYAVLVISAPDGVTAHTKTLWGLLASRGIPTFIFVNKTDISDRRRIELMEELRCNLSPFAVDFMNEGTPQFYESVASADEDMIGEFFDSGRVSREAIADAISKRKVFPCLFGSALKLEGVSELLSVIDRYTLPQPYPADMFGAVVYKISRDKDEKRLTYLKVTGGTLKNKDILTLKNRYGEIIQEKVEEIRIYSADKYRSVSSVSAGQVCAVLGPRSTAVSMGIGFEPSVEPTLVPVLDYRLILPSGVSPYETYMKLTALGEEEPSLAMSYDSATSEIRVRIMGEIQLEVITGIIKDRFSIDVRFDEGKILYKETVADTSYGAGHFEPLRHYAEVHLRIDPMPEGTGVIAATECPTDSLALNWQRLVMTHIEERIHRGVLTASPLTDVKITLTAGRAHLKHTEGGDFRQATYRAIRQGLMKASSILLEPTFDFRLELPSEYLGRAMNDITSMHGTCLSPTFVGSIAVLEGNCPVSTMRSYAKDVRAYTRGEGRLNLTVGAYAPCHNTDEIMAEIGYDPDLDERNTAGSVFCKGGAGYFVPWQEADALMHLNPQGNFREKTETPTPVLNKKSEKDYRGTADEDKELMRIFEATYGKIKPRYVQERVVNAAPAEQKSRPQRKLKPKGEDYVIIDGYNFLFGVPDLRAIAESDIGRARDVIVRLMCNYSSFKKCKSVIVFDAYKRVGGEGATEKYGNVTVVYTKEKQTADSYIECLTHGIAGTNTVRVVTSDMQEQLIVLGVGGLRVSSVEFYREICSVLELIRETIDSYIK